MSQPQQEYVRLERELHGFLDPVLEGIEIEVSFSTWFSSGRNCTQLLFRWEGFADLLAEERFRKVFDLVPPDYYAMKLRGTVWVELAPGESIEVFSKLPRSEEVADDEPRIIRLLSVIDFFDALREVLGDPPIHHCSNGLMATRRILRAKGVPAKDAQAACLTLIRHGAYCDCEALLTAAPKLTTKSAAAR